MRGKMVGLFAAVLIAMMVAGLAYAHWEKTVTISGTVETGTLELTPSIEELWSDDEKGYCTISGYIEGDTIYITVENAYPCITVSGTLNIENTGSVPAGLHDVVVTLPEGVTMVWNEELGCYEIYLGDTLIANFAYEIIEGDIDQIDPEGVVYISFELHFKEGLPQGSSFEFSVELIYYNWNEA